MFLLKIVYRKNNILKTHNDAGKKTPNNMPMSNTPQALVHVRDLLDTQQLWVPLEPGGLGVAPPGLHVLLQGTSPPLTDINATVHAAVVAHLHFSLQRGMQVCMDQHAAQACGQSFTHTATHLPLAAPLYTRCCPTTPQYPIQRRDLMGACVQLMQPPAAASLLVSWQPVLHQLQLTAAQHTIVVSLTRNALERLHILQHKRACMAQEINAACISALTASNGVDKTHVTMVREWPPIVLHFVASSV